MLALISVQVPLHDLWRVNCVPPVKSKPGRNGSPIVGVNQDAIKATRLITTAKADIRKILFLFLETLTNIFPEEVLEENDTILI